MTYKHLVIRVKNTLSSKTSHRRDFTETDVGEILSLHQKLICPVHCNRNLLLWDVTSFSE